MKSLLLLALACLTLTHHSAAAVEAMAPNKGAIEKALTDKSKAAKASWWGFDPEDSTAFLQAAIDSGVSQLIIENLGAPWITEGLKLRSNQEIIFEQDVLILAKRGAFKGKRDALFIAESEENITLSGRGATLRMWKEDYVDPEQYEEAEWRHALSFLSCSNVRVAGLTLAESGGDGIYLGVAKSGHPCSDVVIKEVTCVNNYRQGISVISARNLLIEDCLLKDTSGHAPQAGIDFEPNTSSQELTNCVMRNCVAENNSGNGFHFYLVHLNETSPPLSIRLENCRSIGNQHSLNINAAPKKGGADVSGTIEVIDCEWIDSQDAAISIRNKTVLGASIRIENCTIKNAASKSPETSPIQFNSHSIATIPFGKIHFENCTIEDSLERLPMSYEDFSNSVGLDQITGTIHVKTAANEQLTLALTEARIREWMPFPPAQVAPPFDLAAHRFSPLTSDSEVDLSSSHSARPRGLSQWLLWAEAGDEVAYEVNIHRVGKRAAPRMSLERFSPSGTALKPKQSLVEGENQLKFQASETGLYRIVADPRDWTATVNSSSHRVVLFSEDALFHFLATRGELYFWRPAGNEHFAVKVSGDGGRELVKAALINPQGEVVEEVDNISQAQPFAISSPAEKDEIWCLRLARPSEGYLEDIHVRLEGLPPLLAGNPDDLLRVALEPSEPKTNP